MSLSDIWKNKHLILEGVINKIQAKEEVTKLAEERKRLCNLCPKMSENAKKYSNYKPEIFFKHCTLCGCSIELKTHSLQSSCPDNPPKWTAVVSAEENFTIQQYIKDE